MTKYVVAAASAVAFIAGVTVWQPWRSGPDPVVDAAKQGAKATTSAIDKALEARTGHEHAIEQLARQATELQRQADEARARRAVAEAEAAKAVQTSAVLRRQLEDLERTRAAQPAIRTLAEARDAIAGALKP